MTLFFVSVYIGIILKKLNTLMKYIKFKLKSYLIYFYPNNVKIINQLFKLFILILIRFYPKIQMTVVSSV